MCGIVGLIGKGAPPDPAVMKEMLAIIQHRGPDGQGTYAADTLLLGHRRLVVDAEAQAEHQPMTYLGRYTITCDGRVYNHPELREELKKSGYTFPNGTQAEVLLAAYDHWGQDFLHRLDGMWAFALYDAQTATVFCARDRFAVKPLYYWDGPDTFAFGSEIKQLLIPMGGQPRANLSALKVFLASGRMDYGQETMFAGIQQIPPGQRMVYCLHNHTFEVSPWYNIGAIPPRKEAFAQGVERFRGAFRRAVDGCLRVGGKVGFCLSGGLDSSAIVCTAARPRAGQEERALHAVSSCFDDKRYDEREYVDAVAAHCPAMVSHKVFPDMDRMLEELDNIVWHMDEPFGSSSIYAQWNVFRKAHELGIKVMLDGQGSDEQLAGYTDSFRVLFITLFRQGHFRRMYREMKAYAALCAASEPQSVALLVLRTAYGALIPAWAQKGLYLWRNGRPGAAGWLPRDRDTNRRVYSLGKRYNLRDARAYTEASMHIGLPELFHYVDRDSAAFSVEARMPFLGKEVAETVLAMPLEHRLQGGVTKRVLREALREDMPHKVVERRTKLGFVTPEDQWIGIRFEELRPVVEKAAARLVPVLCPQDVIRWYDQNAKAVSRGDFRLWRVLCVARWADVFDVKIT